MAKTFHSDDEDPLTQSFRGPSERPTYFHYGFRRYDANRYRWFMYGWISDSFDVISKDELRKRIKAAQTLNVAVYDYDESGWRHL